MLRMAYNRRTGASPMSEAQIRQLRRGIGRAVESVPLDPLLASVRRDIHAQLGRRYSWREKIVARLAAPFALPWLVGKLVWEARGRERLRRGWVVTVHPLDAETWRARFEREEDAIAFGSDCVSRGAQAVVLTRERRQA